MLQHAVRRRGAAAYARTVTKTSGTVPFFVAFRIPPNFRALDFEVKL